MQPINYTLQPSAFQNAIPQGINIATQMAQFQNLGEQRQLAEKQRNALKAQQDQQKELQNQLVGLFKNPNTTGREIASIASMFPVEQQKQILAAWNMMGEEKQQNRLSTSGKVLSAILTGKIDIAKDLLQTNIDAATNRGNDAEAAQIRAYQKMIDTDPDVAFKGIAIMTSLVPGGKEVIDNVMKLREGKEDFRVLTKTESENLGLPEGSYQIGPDGKISTIGGKGGVVVNVGEGVKLPTPPSGFDYVRDDSGKVKVDPQGRTEYYPIPGGPADAKVKELEQKKVAQQEAMFESSKLVNDSVKELKSLIKNKEYLVTGASGALIGALPFVREGSARADAEALIDNIQSKIAFETLMSMKQASPTGGALGAVSEKELDLLKADIASLKLSQSPEQLNKNLDKVASRYTNIMKKVDKTKYDEYMKKANRTIVETRVTKDGRKIAKYSDGSYELIQ